MQVSKNEQNTTTTTTTTVIHIYFFCRPGGNRAKIAARAAISKTSQNITQT